MKRRSKNYGEKFWAILTDNYLPLVAKQGSVRDIIIASAQLKDMGHDDLHRSVNMALTIIMDRKLPPSAVISILREWLRELALPLEPQNIPCFGRFHEKYGEKIIRHTH